MKKVVDMLRWFLRNEKVMVKFGKVVSEVDFTLSEVKFLFEKGYEYFLRYGKVPEREWFLVEMEKAGNSLDREVLLNLLSGVYDVDFKKDDFQVDEFRKVFCSFVLKNGLVSCLESIEKEDFDRVFSRLEEDLLYLKRVGGGVGELVDWGATWRERLERRRALSLGSRVVKEMRLGIKDLDMQWRASEGMVVAFIAPTKRYKSIFLVHCGWAGLVQGYSVLHIFYEGKRELYESRYDAKFTEIDYERMKRFMLSEGELKRFESVMKKVEGWSQRLWIVKGEVYLTSVKDIESIILNLDRKVDILIVDYLQLMGSSRRRSRSAEDDWMVLGDITWELVELAEKYNLIVWTALQTTREAFGLENIEEKYVGRSYEVVKALDALIAINQTKEERVEGVARLSPVFFRDAEIKKYDCKVELELWKMNVARESRELVEGMFD